MVTLEDAAAQLYACLPGDFVDRREALTKQARSEGDRVLAQRIKAMRRPTVAAWVLNTLVQEGSTALDGLLAVGGELRTAQAMLDRDAMKTLTTRRQESERAVVADAKDRFAGRGETLTPATVAEIENTLRAAVADPTAAAAVASGQLVRALSYAGFGEVDLTSATAVPVSETGPAGAAEPEPATEEGGRVVELRPRDPAPEPDPDDDAELAAAQQALQEAQQRVARASARRDEAAARRAVAAAEDRARSAEQERRQAQEQVTRLEAELASARERLAGAEREGEQAAAERAEAEQRLAAARRAARAD